MSGSEISLPEGFIGIFCEAGGSSLKFPEAEFREEAGSFEGAVGRGAQFNWIPLRRVRRAKPAEPNKKWKKGI